MSTDLGFNYKRALKRQKFSDSDVTKLRDNLKNISNVPQNLSAKKVKSFNHEWTVF